MTPCLRSGVRISARRDSAIWKVADLLTRHPVINAQLVSTELDIAVGNIHRYIDPLVAVGILTEFTIRKRNRAWRADEILTSLDDFASRAGRRSAP